MKTTRICALLLSLTLAGCAVGPDYVRPETRLPASWALAQGGGVSIDAAWWKQLNDPTLDSLITAALDRNSDVRVAIARVADARAASNEVFAYLFPQIDFALSGNNTKNSALAASQGNGLHRDSRMASISTAYEIDIWGRSRRAREGANARLLGSEYARDAIRISVAGMVAQQYLALRAIDTQLRLTEDSRVAQQATLDIIHTRLNAGLANQLDLARSQTQLAALDAQRASLNEARALREHQLGLLCGQPGLQIERGELRSLSQPQNPPPGLPADLIESRPDVRAAEQALIAANAGIGLAKAAYFPRLSLTGKLGVESQDLADLLKAGSSMSSIGAGLVLPILDFGKTTAQIDAARAKNDQSFVQYQTSLYSAFKEVRDALVSLRERSEVETAQQIRSDRAAEVLKLSRLRFEAGYAPYLEVLDAERTANEARMAMADSRRARLSAWVDLNKALGGGWKVEQ